MHVSHIASGTPPPHQDTARDVPVVEVVEQLIQLQSSRVAGSLRDSRVVPREEVT